MNLKADLVKNKGNTILKFNLFTTLLIFIVLCLITFLFLSKTLGIIFTIICICYLIWIFIVTNKLKNIKNNETVS